jgi:Tfp pilus assembly protein PilF
MTPNAPASHLIDQGFLAMKAGEIEHARTLWKQALTQDPENRMLQFNLRKLDSLRPGAK